MRQLLLTLLVIFVASARSSADTAKFRVRRRINAYRQADADDFFLTYSEDGKSKTLESFYLQLFETPSQLQEDAIPILQMAMNKFLLAEFNAQYAADHNELKSVGSEVFWFSSTSRTSGRSLQEVGTDAEMEVTLSFDHEPSPSFKDLEKTIRMIMTDMQYFVGNLTSFQHSDWMAVTEAYRVELPTPEPTQAPVDNTDGIQEADNGESKNADDDEERNSAVGAIVPTTLVAATLVALVAFLFVQRRSRTSAETPKGSDVMFVGVENDLYSMDRSLESSRSPHGLVSPNGASVDYSTSNGPSIGYSASVDDSIPEDSVFSGIDYAPSAGSHVRGNKSLLSGITNASGSTIRASNMDKHDRQRIQSIGASGGSIFAFNENTYDEEQTPSDLEDDAMLPRLAKSDVSEDSDIRNIAPLTPMPNQQDDQSTALQGASIEHPRTSFLACYGSKPPIEPGSSNHVLADLETLASNQVLVDLENLASNRGPSPRDPTPTASRQAGPMGSLSYNLFNCNTGVPNEPLQYELDGSKSAFTNSSPQRTRGNLSCGLNMTTPLTKDATHGMFTPGSTNGSILSTKSQTSARSGRVELDWDGAVSSVGAMNGKSTRSIGGLYSSASDGRRTRSHSIGGSAPRNHLYSAHSGSRSAPSSPERAKAFRPSLLDETEYAGHFNDSAHTTDVANTGYSCYPYPLRNSVAAAPAAPGEEPPQSSRRHVGNTGIDGTAMYQTNAMHPLDWSYKSADIQSGGDSTVSENDGAAMPRQFLFGAKRNGKSMDGKSPGGDPKTPASQKSGRSNTTNESSQGSASRQLINDLVWLERKIADVRQGSIVHDPPAVDTVDSLSYVSDDNDAYVSVSSRDESEDNPTVSTGRNESVMSSIVCRDCYAPPGKLHIVIHSTKDGPAVHTVKQGSSLQGHIFPGDLIISVDNVDTRSFTAEQVMKMMASKSSQERKITVLHFEEED